MKKSKFKKFRKIISKINILNKFFLLLLKINMEPVLIQTNFQFLRKKRVIYKQIKIKINLLKNNLNSSQEKNNNKVMKNKFNFK